MEVLQRENAELRASKVPRSTSKVIENPSTSSMGISRPAAGCFNDLFVGSGGRLPHLARASTPYTNGLEKLATHLGLYLGPQLNDFPEPDDASDVDAAHPFELALAPTALLCKLLIDFAFDELGWLISVVPTSFKAQHDQLWANGKFDLDYLARRVLAWTALYLSLLSYALVYVLVPAGEDHLTSYLNIDDESQLLPPYTRRVVGLPVSHPTRVSFLTAQTRLAIFLADFNKHQPMPS
ncbi:MAG: hypothetical protein CYPHOPRED_002867 [Cyphobasidiales sp. Tagirdzhanova-0007]|nr:MAG: hypothetical protein CYPHOPRED_002867 [Cyphobasidiales sp. Tagirdzhanova-0007]